MTKRTVTNASFTVERLFAAAPARVFQAFADQKMKAQWFIGPDHWEKSDHRLEFRVGGEEHVSGGPPGGPVHAYDSVFRDIVPNERIITTYEMYLNDKRISVSLASLEFIPEGASTRLILTEQGAYLDEFDRPDVREQGTNDLLNKLADFLK